MPYCVVSYCCFMRMFFNFLFQRSPRITCTPLRLRTGSRCIVWANSVLILGSRWRGFSDRPPDGYKGRFDRETAATRLDNSRRLVRRDERAETRKWKCVFAAAPTRRSMPAAVHWPELRGRNPPGNINSVQAAATTWVRGYERAVRL